MLKFISFGSGSSGNCYFLYTENDGLLIDSGLGIRALKKRFIDYGLNLRQVHHILVTHDHADHVKTVGKLSEDLDVEVYATSEVFKGIAGNYCVRIKIASERAKRIEKGVRFQVGDFEVESFHVPHDSFDNVGYRIECQGVVFCIMTDVGHVTDEMKKHISEANYLVLEANHDVEMLKNGHYPAYLKERIYSPNGHLSNTDCAMALAENATPELKHVWLCHLSEENNHPELARKTVESILQAHGIVIGKEFDLDVLKRRMPSGIFDLI